jgi:hypothetical protein
MRQYSYNDLRVDYANVYKLLVNNKRIQFKDTSADIAQDPEALQYSCDFLELLLAQVPLKALCFKQGREGEAIACDKTALTLSILKAFYNDLIPFFDEYFSQMESADRAAFERYTFRIFETQFNSDVILNFIEKF